VYWATLSRILDDIELGNVAALDKITNNTICETLYTLYFQPDPRHWYTSRWLKTGQGYAYYKEGDKNECGNYRPISVIPTISKILEKLVYDELLNFLNDNKIITKRQSSFRKYHALYWNCSLAINQWIFNEYG
jgi:hypothetical protein